MSTILATTAEHSDFATKWGDALANGFVGVPMLLLKNQKRLQINDGELVVLLNILGAWWVEERLPFPGARTLAARMGVTLRTVHRNLAALEERKLIRRVRDTAVQAGSDKAITKYDPSGLVAELRKLADEQYPERVKSQRQNPQGGVAPPQRPRTGYAYSTR